MMLINLIYSYFIDVYSWLSNTIGTVWIIAILYTIVGVLLAKLFAKVKDYIRMIKVDEDYENLRQFIHDHYREIVIALIKRQIAELHISDD